MDGGKSERVYTALFVFCGVGGGALGFQRARVQLRGVGIGACFRVLGGIESDPGTAADFTRLTGAPCLARKVEDLTPADLVAFCGGVVPDVVFFSPPCKASSGLLAAAVAATEKYQFMSQLALVWLRLMFATWGDRVRLVLMENVPRIRTRHADMMKAARDLMRSHGYLIHDEAHNLGEVGGLAQNRERLLFVARHKSVSTLLYKPVKRRVRGVGEVLASLPMPGDPKAGPLHQLPALDPITAIRLALIPAGGDWHDLPAQVVLPPELAAQVGPKGRSRTRKDRTPFNDVYRVVCWDAPAACVTAGQTPSAGVMSVADPRVTGVSQYANNYTVTGWREPSGTVIGKTQLGSGAGSVADPRVTPRGHPMHWQVREWDKPSCTVTGSTDVQEGAPSIADPRTGVESHPHTYGVLPWTGPAHTITGNDAPGGGPNTVADPRPSSGFEQAWGVVPWDRPIGTVTSREHPSNGEFSVADPRPGDSFPGAWGVRGWNDPGATVTGESGPQNGAFTVADPRGARGPVEARNDDHGVIAWTDPAGTITSREGPSNGAFSVADPRITCKTFENSRIYGVIPWTVPSGTIVGHACHDNGPFSVADPRHPSRVPFPVIISLDGTWHRPLTILERAVLQGFDATLDGEPLTLTGKNRSCWSVRVGDAVPPPAGEAMAEQFLLTLVYADSGVFALSSGGGVWVREEARAMWNASYGAVLQ
jgi:site-specific DNA-cytosine methylase